MNGKEKHSLTQLVLAELEPTAKRISALAILESGKVPARYAQTRTARGGKLTYIDHVWTSSLLRDAFGHLWSFDVGNVEMFEFTSLDGQFKYPKFVMATCTLTVEVGGYRTSVSEVGAFDNTQKYNPAAAGASAVHRALVKCVMQMFGLGVEFYRGYKPHAASATDLWANLLEYGTGQGLTEAQIIAAIKSVGVTKETLVSRFDEARDAVGSAADKELIEDQFRPTKQTWAMPTESPDPLVEAALELGGKVVDQETGEILDEEPKAPPVSTDGPINWVKLYEWCEQNWDDRFGKFRSQDAKDILLDIFGCKATELQQVGKQKIFTAFLEYMGSTDNESREAIREKYRG